MKNLNAKITNSRAAFALIAVVLLAACRPTLTEGIVAEKEYHPPRSWTTQERVCAWRDYSSDDYYSSCLMWTYETHDHYDPEEYMLRIQGFYEGEAVEDWVNVDSGTYDRCIVGRHYPDCGPV